MLMVKVTIIEDEVNCFVEGSCFVDGEGKYYVEDDGCCFVNGESYYHIDGKG